MRCCVRNHSESLKGSSYGGENIYFHQCVYPGISQQNKDTDKCSPDSWKIRKLSNLSILIYFKMLMGKGTSLP